MESANLHHQDVQLVGSSSSSSPPPLPTPPSYYSYGASAGSNHSWSSLNNPFLNTNLNPNLNGAASEARNDDFTPHHDFPVTQNLGFPWPSSNKVKEELSLSSSAHSNDLPKFTKMLTNVDLSEKLLLKTISASSFHFNGHDQLGDHQLYSSNLNMGRSSPSFSQIYPSINVSSLSKPDSAAFPSSSSSSLNMNLQALHLSTNARFSDHPNNLDMFKDSFISSSGFDNHQMQESFQHRPSCSPNKVQKAATEAKRASCSLAEPSSHTPKKPRSDSRPSCPTLKVRKEKLGDRIAALQQLVAPFGKTDTASVLMEAIGYIQFLQNQVKTLSVPYMKSSRNKSCRTMQAGSNEEGNEVTRPDLRSRGLCLVPLSCTTYVDSVDGGGSDGLWPPPPSFGGGGASTLP